MASDDFGRTESERKHLLHFSGAATQSELLLAGIEPLLADRRQACDLALQVVTMQVTLIVLLERRFIREVCARGGAIKCSRLHISTSCNLDSDPDKPCTAPGQLFENPRARQCKAEQESDKKLRKAKVSWQHSCNRLQSVS